MATNQSNSLSGTLSATIVRVFPNGNLEIKGQKKLRITEGTEYIRLSGIIRPEDISTTNTVSSAKIAEAQIEYVGAEYSIVQQNQVGVAKFLEQFHHFKEFNYENFKIYFFFIFFFQQLIQTVFADRLKDMVSFCWN